MIKGDEATVVWIGEGLTPLVLRSCQVTVSGVRSMELNSGR